MILDKILGNAINANLQGCHTEIIYLDSNEMKKKVIRGRSDHGTDFGIIVPNGEILKDGDILLNDGYNVVLVKLAKEDVLRLKPKDLDEMGEIAHYIGNKHIPAQFIEGEIIVQYDRSIEEDLKFKKIEYSREQFELKKAFKMNDITHRH